jgi:hypothetical protein
MLSWVLFPTSACFAYLPPQFRWPSVYESIADLAVHDSVIHASNRVFSDNKEAGIYELCFLSISSSIFRSNSALKPGPVGGHGGGIFVHNSQLFLESNEFISNCGIYGGALFLSNSDLIIESSVFQGNRALSMAGGIGCFCHREAIGRFAFLRNVTFDSCQSKELYGAAFFLNYPDLFGDSIEVVSCFAAVAGGGIAMANSTAFFVGCHFFGSTGADESDGTGSGPLFPDLATVEWEDSGWPPTDARPSSTEWLNSWYEAVETLREMAPADVADGSDYASEVDSDLNDLSLERPDLLSPGSTAWMGDTFSESVVQHTLLLELVVPKDPLEPLKEHSKPPMERSEPPIEHSELPMEHSKAPMEQSKPPMEHSELPMGGRAIFVVQEQLPDDPEFELITQNCVFDDDLCNTTCDGGSDIGFVGYCRWFSFEDQFSNLESAVIAFSRQCAFCEDHDCSLVRRFYRTTFSSNGDTSWQPPPVESSSQALSRFQQADVLEAGPAADSEMELSSAPVIPPPESLKRLSYLTMPLTPTRPVIPESSPVQSTATETDVIESPTLQLPSPSPIPSVSASPIRTRSLESRYEYSYIDSYTESITASFSYIVQMTFSPSNVVVSRSMGTIIFHGNTFTFTVIHYTTWEYSYQAIPTLTLTFAAYPVVILTRAQTMIYHPTVLARDEKTPVAARSGMVIGIVIGVAGGILLVSVMIWFVVSFSRRQKDVVKEKTTGSELSDMTYAVLQIGRERIQNPIFCGFDRDSETDPFYADFAEIM